MKEEPSDTIVKLIMLFALVGGISVVIAIGAGIVWLLKYINFLT